MIELCIERQCNDHGDYLVITTLVCQHYFTYQAIGNGLHANIEVHVVFIDASGVVN